MAKLKSCVVVFAVAATVAGNCSFARADGAGPGEIPLLDTAAASHDYLKKSEAAGRCWAADIARGQGGVLAQGNAANVLPAGRYRLHARLAVAPLGDLHMSAISIDLGAAGATRSVGVLRFALADEFHDETLDFSTSGGQCPYSLKWSRTGLQAHKNEVQATDLTAIDPDKDNDAGDLGPDAPATAGDGTIAMADLGKIKYHVAFAGIHLEKLSPVAVDTVATDKITYKPGDAGSAKIVVHNYSDQAQSAHLTVSIDSGLADNRALHEETVELAPQATRELAVPFATNDLYWGCNLVAKASLANGESDVASDTFAVSRNFWETALVQGMHYSDEYADPKAAEATAKTWRGDGYTVFESGFWAADEFGDFTPEKDWLSGQCCYRESVTGSKNMIAAAHRQGIAATVYSNLWGGDGPPAFEMMRAHPDWVGSAEFGTDWLDMWPMGRAGKIALVELWPFTCISDDGTKGALVEHANQFIKSHSMYGWDGTRYDSYGSSDWTKMATAKVRAIVEKAVPDYRWGYNTSVPLDEKLHALDIMIGGGGLEMEESIRSIAKSPSSFASYANTVVTYRDIIWPHGGHFGVCYDRPKDQTLDEIYLSSFLLAAGVHPYYSKLEDSVGNYPNFALRYSEFLWNNKMRPLKDPGTVVQFEGDPHLVEWKRLVRTVDLGANKHRLIVHLINAPVDDTSLHNYAYKTPAPLRELPLSIGLPAGAQVSGVYDLCPISTPYQQSLHFDVAGDKLKLKVPQVRFWDAIVIDYTAAGGIQ